MIARKTPLKRSGSPLKRSTAKIARRRVRPARVRKTEAGQARLKADRAWSEAVKANSGCVLPWVEPNHECFGPIDAAHVISRRYAATRHLTKNGLPICRRGHDYYTANPLKWAVTCAVLIGETAYEALRVKALQGTK